jgi:hypothetical protein
MEVEYKNIYVIWLEGAWRRGVLKVKVAVAMKTVAGRSQGCGKLGWAVSKTAFEVSRIRLA